MELKSEFESLLRKWGSEERVYEFLQDQASQLAELIFENPVAIPNLQVLPSWLKCGIMGEHGKAAGTYDPAEKNQKAEIGIFATTLMDEDRSRRVLAHELIHHWEYLSRDVAATDGYSDDIDNLISEAFETKVQETIWRGRHSRRFIAKASRVAEALGVSVRELLFGH
jgi:hypothetical protein